MKILSLAAAIFVCSAASTFAITNDDISPPALVGRTLVFNIENGGSPYATNGTWSGTFARTKNGFSVDNIDGDTIPIDTTYSVDLDGPLTKVSLGKFVEGLSSATLTLYTSNGVGRYSVSIQGVSGASLFGTFTISGGSLFVPEIEVRLLSGTNLKDGSAKKNFGSVRVDTTGAAQKFFIKNIGFAPLKNLDITINGPNKSDFIVSKLTVGKLASKDRTEFTVKFNPSKSGPREAAIHIKSNDTNESPFDIRLTGTGSAK